jgi:hypothetical protein
MVTCRTCAEWREGTSSFPIAPTPDLVSGWESQMKLMVCILYCITSRVTYDSTLRCHMARL